MFLLFHIRMSSNMDSNVSSTLFLLQKNVPTNQCFKNVPKHIAKFIKKKNYFGVSKI